MRTILTIIAAFCCATVFSQAGALDSSFGTNGKFIYSNSGNSSFISGVTATAIQKDGKILIAGYGNNYNGNGSQDFTILRLNTNGSIDNSFGTAGKVFVDFSDVDNYYSNDAAYAITVQPNGKIVVAGDVNAYYYIDSLQTYNYGDIGVARINADGSLDTSFHATGKVIIDLSEFTKDPNLYNSSYDYCYSVAVKQNSKIIIGGATYTNDALNGNNYDAVIVQLNANGSFDAKFANTGVQLIKKPGGDDYINSLAIQADGKIIGGGNTGISSNSSRDLLAVRLQANGALDNTFGTNGIVSTDLSNNSYDNGGSLAIQSNGKIVESGYASGLIGLVRFNTNGKLDKTFNGNGKSIYPRNDYVYQSGVSVLKDGRIVQTGGEYPYSNNTDGVYLGANNFIAFRYKANGAIDSSFGTLGSSIIDFGKYTDGSQDYSQASALQADDKIVLAGYIISSFSACATRLQEDGKNISVLGPSDQTDTASAGNCTVTLNNIDPVLYPDTAFSLIKYNRYISTNYTLAALDSGYGSLSSKPFDIGNTTVVYTSTIDPLQRAVFNVNVAGGTPAGALDFDGINDRVDINYLSDPVASYNYGQYSFEAWIKVRGYNKTEGSVIFANERNNNGGIIVSLDTKGFITTYQPSVGTITSKSKVPLNKWTHIAFVQSSTKLDLYVNGKFVQTLLTAPNLHGAVYSNAYLGAYTSDNVNFSRHFNGEMEEVRIWGSAICPGQIVNNLRCEIPDYPIALIADFSFNQGLASCNNPTITSANGRNTSGTLQNFALTGPTSNWVVGYVSGSCAVFTPLSVITPSPIYQAATADSCGATINFAVTISGGCSDSVTVTYSQNPGTFFPVGTTYVYVTVQDAFGNTQYTSFPITVTESQPPVLIVKDTTITLDYNGNAYLNPYNLVSSLTDNCTPSNNLYLNAYPIYFSCYNVGPNTVNLSVTDQSGNSVTQTAIVTVLPYVGSATITASPNPQQYSDVATLQATLYGAQNFYYNGCLQAPDVTFKVGSKVIGDVIATPDFNGNLTATLSYPLTDIFPKKISATFNGLTSFAYSLPTSTVSTTLNGTPENAVVDYTESQFINATSNKVTIPVAAQIIDTADGSKGDIRKAIVTFTIQPITAGAKVIGSNTLTVSSLEFLNADKTSGVARGSFTVNTGGVPNAKFNIIVTVSNYYTGSKTVLVYVTKSGSSFITLNDKASLSEGKLTLNNQTFGVIVSPNPSQEQFTLLVKSSNLTDKIDIRISDVMGKVLETFSNIQAGDAVQLGSKYRAGVYIAEITQGSNRKSYKLIKL